MLFKPNSPVYSTEMQKVQGEDVLYVNVIGAAAVPSIAENPAIMARTVDLLTENPTVSRFVFVQQRNYSYPNEQILSPQKISLFGNTPEVHEDLRYLVELLKQDPISCYTELKNRIKSLRSQL